MDIIKKLNDFKNKENFNEIQKEIKNIKKIFHKIQFEIHGYYLNDKLNKKMETKANTNLNKGKVELSGSEELLLTQGSNELASWTRIGIASGLLACIVYPIMILVAMARIPQIIIGASFGPALVVASIALAFILQARRRTPSLVLAPHSIPLQEHY